MDIQYYFYECDNPDCGLRFPGYEGFPRWNRCPLCRSTTHAVAPAGNIHEEVNPVNLQRELPIEGLLDNIRSAWNVGSIFRTADGTGIRKLYLCGITPTPENQKVCKTALGAEANISWAHTNNAVKIANTLKSRGHLLLALEDLPGSIPLFKVEISQINTPLLLIVGNEICGVDPGLIDVCDQVISIPMLGTKKSYNVAIAFSIAASFLLYRFYTNARVSPMDPLRYSPGSG